MSKGERKGEREEAEYESITHVLHDGGQDLQMETEGKTNLRTI